MPVLFCSPQLLSKFKLPVPLNWLLTCTCVQGAPPFSPARPVVSGKQQEDFSLTTEYIKKKKEIACQEGSEGAPEDLQLHA